MLSEMLTQIETFPLWLQLWLNWMQFILILMPVIFINRREAQIILV